MKRLAYTIAAFVLLVVGTANWPKH